MLSLRRGWNEKNYAQTLKVTTTDIPEANSSIYQSLGGYNVQVQKSGSIVCLSGLVQNASGVDQTTNIVFGTIPLGYRPSFSIFENHTNESSVYTGIKVESNGELLIYATAGIPFKANSWKSIDTCWFTN